MEPKEVYNNEKYQLAFEANWNYHNPSLDKFPIMAFSPTVIISYDKKDLPVAISVDPDINRMKECGFNLAYAHPSLWSIPSEELKDFTFCVLMPNGETKPNGNINPFIVNLVNNGIIESDGKINKNISMIDFGDEPNEEQLENMCHNYNMARVLGISQVPFVNFAINAKPKNPTNSDEKNLNIVLDVAQELLHPAMWCYDYYPIYRQFKPTEDASQDYGLYDLTGLTPTTKIYVNRNMYLWLEIFLKRAKEKGIPFWYCVLSREFQSLMGLDDKKSPRISCADIPMKDI